MAAPVAQTGTGNVTTTSGASVSTLTCNKPANVVNGDLMVAYVVTQNNAVAFTVPSGWTLIGPASQAGGAGTIDAYYKVAASEGASYTFSWTGAGRSGMIIQRVTGFDTGTVIDAAGAMNTVNTVPTAISAITTTVTNTLVFAAYLFRGTDPAETTTALSGFAQALTSPLVIDNGSSFTAISLCSAAQTATGTTGTQTPTADHGTAMTGVLFAVRPVPTTPPTAAFTSTFSALFVSVDGSTSSATGATITGYDWDWGDGGAHGTGSTSSHTYAAGGTYSITLTVTDSNANTATVVHAVTVAAPSGTATAAAVTASTGWTASSGTVLSAITDNDATTFDSSSANPTGLEFDIQLLPMVPPATGQPLKVFFTMDATLATSATLNAQLYEGATSRSTLTGVTIPSGSGSSVVGLVTLTFPWTDVQNVTTGGWNSGLTVKLQVTAS